MFDPQTVLSGRSRRGVPAGVIVAITGSSICLALFLGLMLLAGGMSFMAAATLSLFTLVPMMALVLVLDSLEPEPRHLLVATFLWGAGTAVVLSAVVEIFGGVTLTALDGGSPTTLAVVIAPAVEETMKGLAVFAVFWFRRNQIHGITDGVVYAATSALGFAAAENIAYYVAAVRLGGGEALAAMFMARGVLSAYCHPVFTAMTGIAIGLAARARGAARGLFPVGGLLLAMILHGAWNGLGLSGWVGGLVAWGIMGGVLVAVLVALRHDRRRTMAQIASCLTAYVPTGLVTGADLAMMSTGAGRQRARAWARATCGPTGFNAMRDYQRACAKLTTLHDGVSLGLIDRYEFERSRWLLLTLMRFAREAFLRPAQVVVPWVSAPWAQQYVPPLPYNQPAPYVPPQPNVPGPAYVPGQLNVPGPAYVPGPPPVSGAPRVAPQHCVPPQPYIPPPVFGDGA